MNNIRAGFKKKKIKAKVIRKFDRVLVETKEMKKTSELLKHVFGIVSFSPVYSMLLNELKPFIEKNSKKLVTGKTFAVRVRRVGKHSFTSMELARELGAIVVDKTKKKVRLKNPDTELSVEIRDQDVYIFTERIKTPGGLPLGSQGKVVCLVDDKRGALAAWFIMKRGCSPVFAYRKKKLKILDRWLHGVEAKWIKVKELKDLDRVAKDNKALAIVLPNTLKKNLTVDTECLILEPLITFTEKEIRTKL